MKDLFYLISIPIKNNNKLNLVSELKASIINSKSIQDPSSAIHTIDLPAFKYGTLAACIVLSEELVKYDQQITSVIQKYIESSENLGLTNTFTIDQLSPKDYVNGFLWNNFKYKRTTSNLDEITEAIIKNVNAHELDFKNKQQDYQLARGTLTQLERKQLGNLSTKSLAGVVSQSDVIESDFLETLFVAVPL